MSIKIPISADFNGDDVTKQIAQINAKLKSMGDAVAKANGTKFEPITLKGKEDLKYFVQQSEKLLKIQGELRNRMQKSGQQGQNPFMANWSNLYLNESTRLKRQQEALIFLGASFEDEQRPNTPKPPKPAPTPPVPRNPGRGGGNGQGGGPANPWVQQGGRILTSGLNAAGPIGGVASQAVGTGMASGFGAGLMGLLGGVLALGVGKAVSSVMENLDKAERNNIEFDTLKRTIGDVNVSFEGLKSLIENNATNLGITFDEAAKLTTQFSKLGNVTPENYKELGGELANGVGFSRGFGLDPAMGMSFFGQMRGVRMTSNDQDSRRMGLLIGETIAKSDAFAKADEVMESIAGYVTSQTRSSLNRANVAGYAGMFSALTSSGIPGLDVAGTSGLLSRVNSALMGGGAKGEASQFFSSMVANSMGLNPMQMAIMREGGAFATNDSMFGEGSIASRFGIQGPGGNKTFLQGTLDMLRRKYPDKNMQAMAASNHLGISMGQAMSLLMIDPNQMGALQKGLEASGVDMSRLNSSGIANLTKVYGSDADRQGLAQSLLRRDGDDALTATEAERLRNVMSSGSTEEQKKVLTELIATREQERTMGTDIRDSKAILDNIKTSLAEKLIPLTQEMRHGIMYLAGKDKDLTPQQIMEDVIQREYKGKANGITGRYAPQIEAQAERYRRAQARSLNVISPEEANLPREEQLAAVNERVKAAQAEMADAEKEINRLKGERDAELEANSRNADTAVKKMYRDSDASSQLLEDRDGSFEALVEAMFEQESNGRHTDKNGNLTTSPKGARGISQVMPATGTDPGFGVAPLQNHSEAEYRRFGSDYLAAMMRRYGNDRRKALAAYNAGPGAVDSAIRNYGDDWLAHLPQETQSYVPSILRKLPKKPAQLPANDAGNSRQDVNITVGELEVVHRNERGEQIAPSQKLKPKVSTAKPFGTG